MGSWLFAIEIVAFYGIVVGWAIWEYRKTSKMVDDDRAKKNSDSET
ncbi:MAG: hypothetical protein AAFY43_04285 [Pseudomonadota bacterium]